MTKSLKELTFNVPESLYREDSALSYSIIARYEKGGFYSIAHLFDKQEGEALTFGSIVDTLITEGTERFYEKFAIANFPTPSDSLVAIADILLDNFTDETMDTISDNDIVNACNSVEYQTRWKNETRISKVRESCTAYYNAKKAIGNRILISNEMYQDALRTVHTLKSSPQVNKYLQQSEGETEFLYQQKFKATIDGLSVRCMFDILICQHEKKCIIPIDLKTTSVPEYDFPKKYLENRYDIQSRLYWDILRYNLDQDEYFKDFTILPFRFMVINKDSLTPLMFVDENSCSMSTSSIWLKFKSGRELELRAPITIGKELKEYLDNNSKIPSGIEINKLNNIYERINLL